MGQNFCSLTIYHIVASEPKNSTRDHPNCDRDQCRAFQQVDSKNYRPRHAKQDCQCGLVGTREPELAELVTGGAIPIISYSDQEGL